MCVHHAQSRMRLHWLIIYGREKETERKNSVGGDLCTCAIITHTHTHTRHASSRAHCSPEHRCKQRGTPASARALLLLLLCADRQQHTSRHQICLLAPHHRVAAATCIRDHHATRDGQMAIITNQWRKPATTSTTHLDDDARMHGSTQLTIQACMLYALHARMHVFLVRFCVVDWLQRTRGGFAVSVTQTPVPEPRQSISI